MPISVRLTWFYRHLLLWALQAWLAMFYIGAAMAKLSQPRELLSHLMHWTARVDPGAILIVGGLELAFAIGVLAPLASWSIFRPVLLVSATGLFFNAVFMAGYHASLEQGALAAVNVVLAVIAAIVITGRRSPVRRSGAVA